MTICTTTRLDLCVPQGTTWAYQLTLYIDADGDLPRDITLDEFKLQVRETKGSSRILIELDSTLGDITKPDAVNGVLLLHIDPDKTVDIRITDDALNAVYDLELTDETGGIFRIIEGTFIISKEVTR